MSKILDRQFETDICFAVTEALEGEGYSPEEIIPGLVKAIIEQSVLTDDTDQTLDEVADLINDEYSEDGEVIDVELE